MAMDGVGYVAPGLDSVVSAVALFRSLADETLLRIMQRLAGGEARVVDLNGKLVWLNPRCPNI